ncbi:dynamin [Achlya hypogyna]|uniref:Dynamin n=1 Tax=Achlya hypogyna TaxID=1202772 RepID=A0A1V9Z8K1_ACHHY|nr:dynamin [Achlya hypogyna]
MESFSGESRHLIDRLRALGIGEIIELPQIAVMGDTSSGKSSVLSAISGITFPSSDLLTTRCPTQLILSNAPSLSGTVRLVRFQRPDESQSPKTITSLEEVTESIESLTQQLVDEGQVISDDAIEITMQGPKFPNLTLLDLPGLVRTVRDDEDPAMIGRVRTLVQRYLTQSRTIILAVVPANVDMHNTEIMQAAEEADPLGTRTISIITKPDLIDDGAEAAVRDLLLNITKRRRLGYHMVKCRGQRALANGVSIDEGRAAEKTYFATHPVWSAVDPSLVGSDRLAHKLSLLLVEAIAAAMPAVFAEIDAQTKTCKAGLLALGHPMNTPAARRLCYMEHVRTVADRIEDALIGNYVGDFFYDGSVDNRLRAQLRELDTKFQESIAALSEVASKTIDRSSQAPAIGDFVEVDATNTNTWKLEKVTNVSFPQICSSITDEWTTNWRHLPELDLADLKALMLQSRGDELSLFLSYPTFANVIRQRYVSKWRSPVMAFHRGYKSLLHDFVGRAIASTGATYLVQSHLTRVASDVIELVADEALDELNRVLETENRPYTLSHELYDAFMQLRMQPLLDGLKALGGVEDNVSMGAVLALLKAHSGMMHGTNDDQQVRELHMAIMAYIRVASMRFTDAVPILLQSRFLKPFIETFRERLVTSEGTDDLLQRILVDSVADVFTREKLSEKLFALEKAKAEIGLPTAI